MKQKLKPNQKVVKRATGTRWSSRYNACSSFKNSWEEFMAILNDIENNNSENPINRKKAAGLKTNFSTFESVFMAIFWTSLLEQFNKTSTILQSTSVNLEHVVDLYKSLIGDLSEIRTDEMFRKFIDEAKKIRKEEYKLDKKRRLTRSLLCDELDECSSRANEVVLAVKIN
jgi:hypothetical protein